MEVNGLVKKQNGPAGEGWWLGQGGSRKQLRTGQSQNAFWKSGAKRTIWWAARIACPSGPVLLIYKKAGKEISEKSPTLQLDCNGVSEEERQISDVIEVNPQRVDADERMKEGGWTETNGG